MPPMPRAGARHSHLPNIFRTIEWPPPRRHALVFGPRYRPFITPAANHEKRDVHGHGQDDHIKFVGSTLQDFGRGAIDVHYPN